MVYSRIQSAGNPRTECISDTAALVAGNFKEVFESAPDLALPRVKSRVGAPVAEDPLGGADRFRDIGARLARKCHKVPEKASALRFRAGRIEKPRFRARLRDRLRDDHFGPGLGRLEEGRAAARWDLFAPATDRAQEKHCHRQEQKDENDEGLEKSAAHA